MKNKKRKKTILAVGIIVVVALVMISFFPTSIPHTFFAPSKSQIEWMNVRDKRLLTSVAEYFIESGYESISIRESDYIYNNDKKGYMYVEPISDNSRKLVRIEIEDPKVNENIELLLRWKGYGNIGKNENTIYFEPSNMFRSNRGIACTIDGERPQMAYLVDYKLISGEHWYYYKENYEEHKLIRRQILWETGQHITDVTPWTMGEEAH